MDRIIRLFHIGHWNIDASNVPLGQSIQLKIDSKLHYLARGAEEREKYCTFQCGAGWLVAAAWISTPSYTVSCSYEATYNECRPNVISYRIG